MNNIIDDNLQDFLNRKLIKSIKLTTNEKIIEFNGDYWHRNPNTFSADSIILNKKTSEIWAKDSAKLKLANDNGYNTLVVWQSEYLLNKIDIINKCITFLKQ